MLLTCPLNSESYGNWIFDTSVLEVPTGKLLTFCTDNDFLEDFFRNLSEIAAKAKSIAIASLVLLAIVAIAVMGWWEIQRYRKAVQKCQMLANREPMDASYMASRPLTAGAGLWLSGKLTRNQRRQTVIRWVIAYATTYTALFVLSLAIAGGISSLGQFLVMRAVQKETPALASEVSSYVGDVVAELEQASMQWANASNTKMLAVQDEIDKDLRLHVVQATNAVNATLLKLNREVNATLMEMFGNTTLEAFLHDIYNCILGDKLAEVGHGIDWVHAHAQISVPLLPAQVFSFGENNAAVSSVLTSPTAATTVDGVTSAVDKVVDKLWAGVVQESVLALVLLVAYVLYACFGVVQAALQVCFGGRYGTVAGDATFGRVGL